MSHYIYDVVSMPNKKFIVIFDHTPTSADGIKVKVGESVTIRRKLASWAEVETADGRHGWLPQTFMAPVNSLEAKPWFFPETTRGEANDLLLLRPAGTFLVREAHGTGKEFALSIRTQHAQKPVCHYKIEFDPKNGYYIQHKLADFSLTKLISYYEGDTQGRLKLEHVLLSPCPKRVPRTFQLEPRNLELRCSELVRSDSEAIGTGHFSQVYQAFYRHHKVAIKEMKNIDDIALNKELRALRDLHHLNVITFYGFCKESSWLVFEYAEYCLQKQLKAEAYNSDKLHVFAVQIARGMQYIHSKNYIHRDLATRNVLITYDSMAKISDFGLSRKLTESEIYHQSHPTATPFRWEAIESLIRREYNKATDVWSFGVLLIEMYTSAATPYQNFRHKDELIRYLSDGNRLAHPERMPAKFYELAVQCWNKNPKKRPDFKQVYKCLSH